MIQTLTLRTHSGADGQLHLNIPTTLTDADLDITILIRPVLAEANHQPETFSQWWSKQLMQFPDAATKAAERDLRYEYLAERYKL